MDPPGWRRTSHGSALREGTSSCLRLEASRSAGLPLRPLWFAREGHIHTEEGVRAPCACAVRRLLPTDGRLRDAGEDYSVPGVLRVRGLRRACSGTGIPPAQI